MTAIKVENLSKRYFLGEATATSLRDWVNNFVSRRGRPGKTNQLWALKDINFEVADGETLGIIGNNGAGKSTLLKILSRITKPTGGSARISGRIGSLLEVGTGFHDELSGRENIFLNGAILGMRRIEIERKFDEIVAFSEIERFLDTPVKHYSSGMYMRLAFSVAAHLDPEILIVDEVLAVGDHNFQLKCLKKMRDVGESGRTVLFVSHDMQAMTRLCSRVIWLKDGVIERDGEVEQIVGEYLHEQSKTGAEKNWEIEDAAPGDDVARLLRVRVSDETGASPSTLDIKKPIAVEMTYKVLTGGNVLIPNMHFYNAHGVCLFVSHDWYGGWRTLERDPGVYTSTVSIPGNFFAEGSIFVGAALTTYQPFEIHFFEKDVITFVVFDSFEGDTARGDYAGELPGIIRPVLNWETSKL
jgi:lipopolysaccharide transport system ATP-binding protein